MPGVDTGREMDIGTVFSRPCRFGSVRSAGCGTGLKNRESGTTEKLKKKETEKEQTPKQGGACSFCLLFGVFVSLNAFAISPVFALLRGGAAESGFAFRFPRSSRRKRSCPLRGRRRDSPALFRAFRCAWIFERARLRSPPPRGRATEGFSSLFALSRLRPSGRASRKASWVSPHFCFGRFAERAQRQRMQRFSVTRSCAGTSRLSKGRRR